MANASAAALEAPAPVETQFDPRAVAAITRPPLVDHDRNLAWITNRVAGIVESKTPIWWWVLFVPSAMLAGVCFTLLAYLISTGIGVWGENIPVAWAWDITNFVFWIGIGHAGTLISAILFLTRQRWRTSINRAAEAMTLFAVICAGLYPALHIGRQWMAWFLAPVPNQYAIWQNFKSPLMWDVFAVSTYFTVSVLFWYTGLVPDLATMRDRAKGRIARTLYGVFALGWRGSNRNWRHYEMAYLLLAGLSTPLVLSVHSIVSFDFATSVVPGWHTTIFPPYFVAGAIFGGFAMVLTLMLPARAIFGLQDMITTRHIDVMAKIILLTGSIVGYAYFMEFFTAWYSGNHYERFHFLYNRVAGPYKWFWVCMTSFNVISPQVFWIRWCRRNVFVVFAVCMFVNAGMWFERFVIIVSSIHRDFLPSSWGMFHPTWVDKMTFLGTFGLFLSLFLLFIRFLPMIAMAEVKGVLPIADPHAGGDHARKYGYAAGPQINEPLPIGRGTASLRQLREGGNGGAAGTGDGEANGGTAGHAAPGEPHAAGGGEATPAAAETPAPALARRGGGEEEHGNGGAAGSHQPESAARGTAPTGSPRDAGNGGSAPAAHADENGGPAEPPPAPPRPEAGNGH